MRAIDERFYGRTARIFYVGAIQPEQVSVRSPGGPRRMAPALVLA